MRCWRFKLRHEGGKGVGETAFQADSSACAKVLRLQRNLACSKQVKGDQWVWIIEKESGEVGGELEMNARV